MKKETKSRLGALMNKYDQRLKEAKEVKRQREAGGDVFLKEFERLQKEIIRPVMEDIGNELKTRGHKYRISEKEESSDSEGRVLDARISMSIFPSGINSSAYGSESFPSISFIATKWKRKIWVHENTMVPGRGGHGGSIGEFDSEEITGSIVEEKILEVLKKIFD